MLPILALLLSAILWGLAWWPLKRFAALGVDGVPLTLVVYGSVGVVLLPLLLRERPLWRGKGRLLLWLCLLGGYSNLAFVNSLIYGEVVRAMMLFYLAPVWGVLGGRLLLNEPIDVRRALGVVLAIGGAALVLGGSKLLASAPQPVDLLALSSGLAFGLGNVAARAACHLPMSSKAAAVFLGGAVMAALLLLTTGTPLPAISPAVTALLALFGLGWLLLGTFGSIWAVGRLGAGRASVILAVELVVAVVSATLIGDESLEWDEAIGGGLILLAALLEGWRSPHRPRQS